MNKPEIIKTISGSGLRVTPQRIAVLDAVISLKNHPTAENVIDFLKANHPNIAAGTVYKTLETFVEKGIICKVKSDKDIMRYDAVSVKHHHLYCAESERIEDFFDEDLSKMIDKYLTKKVIPNFTIKDIKLQIIGTFTDRNRKK